MLVRVSRFRHGRPVSGIQQQHTIKAKDAIRLLRLLWVKNSDLTLTKLFDKGQAC
jgi:hypothetical protein